MDPGLKLMDPLPEERRWRAFPRFPLIDDGLTGGADQARESSLADVEVSAQRFGCLRRSLLIGQLYLRDRGGNDGLAPGTLEQ